jgi:hypothetical protein
LQNATGGTANYNTAVGNQSLYANTTASHNTALGHYSGRNVTTGYDSVFMGSNAGASITTGWRNAYLGYQAGYLNQTSGANTGVGYGALYASTYGGNTGVGYLSFYGTTTGAYNTGIGQNSGLGNTTGSHNTYIGYDCYGNAGTDTNSIVIGTNSHRGKGSSTGFIAPAGGGVYQGNNSSSWSTTSDERLKKNIVDNDEGLNKINAIQVRNFEYRTAEEVTELDPINTIDISGVQLGVIAQELEAICPECVKTESTGVKSVDTDSLFWHMLNAVKDLSAKNDALEARIAALES